MEDLKKSIQKLLKRPKKKPKERICPSPQMQTTLTSYIVHPTVSPEQRLRSHNPVRRHNQQQQNMRLYRKLTEIKKRQNTYDHSPQEQLHSRVYRLNMASRRVQRQLKDKDLHEKNRQIQKMISFARKHSTRLMEGRGSRSRQRKKQNKSVTLPPIE